MSLSPQDAIHLARALTLAENAVGLASPNPTVGCVLTRDGAVLGEGAHLYDERDHAEVVALRQAASARHGAVGATAYVTLEPCSHHGRTGPCADALVAAGVRRCLIATLDPNPLVSGSGVAKLRSAKVDVQVLDPAHPLARQARQLNDGFAHFIRHGRPLVTLKAALSIDGKLAPPASARAAAAPHWLTGTAARADVQMLRHASDALLTGIGTVLADNPSLTDRTRLPRRRPLLRVVLDARLRIPLDSAVLTGSSPSAALVLCSEALALAPAGRERALRDRGVDVHRLPADAHGGLDLHAALTHLAGRNILNLLVEAGPTVNASLLRADLADRLVLYYAGRELGPDALPFAYGLGSPYDLQQRLSEIARTTFPSDISPGTEDIRVTGYRHNPWPSAQ